MVSLDEAVIARYEKFGKRFELLVDSDLIDSWKEDSSKVPLEKLLAIEDVFHDARDGERPTGEILERAFESTDFEKIANIILTKGNISPKHIKSI